MDNAGHAAGPTIERSRWWRSVAAAGVILLLVTLVGWLVTARDSPAPVQTSVDGKVIEEIPVADRVTVKPFKVNLLDGNTFDSRELLGRVTVYNVWGSWCGPCRTEAPALARVARETSTETTFVGINMRDNDDAARAFERTLEVPYESVTTDDSGEALLAFQSTLSSAAIPSTVVVDREGRVAVRVVGPVTYSTLRSLVSAVLAEGSCGRR